MTSRARAEWAGVAVVLLASASPSCGGRAPRSERAGGARDPSGAGRAAPRAPRPVGPARALAAGEAAPRSLALEACCVFWTDAEGRIRKVPKTGGEVKTLATWPGAHHLAAGGGLLFATVKTFAQYRPRSDASFAWGDVWEEVRAIPLAGGEELSVVRNQLGFADTTAPNLAADASGLYWIHAAEPAVLHLPHGQRDARLLALGDEASAVAPLPHPSYVPVLAGIALGADFVAWSGKTLRAMPKGGGAIRDLAADLEPARDHAAGERGVFLGPVVGMAADASAVYLALAPSNETSGAIITVPVDGSRPRRPGEAVVAPCELPAPCEPVGLAVDGDHVYWTNAGDGTIARAPKRGGAPEVVARGQPSPVAIGVDEASVFWVNLGGEAGRLRDGSVARADK